MEKKVRVTGSMVITLNSLHYEQKRTLNDSWLKKEGEDNMKTENLQKGEGQEKEMLLFTFMMFHCDKQAVLQLITGSSKEHISSIILQMDASCSANCCCPTVRLHFDPAIGTRHFLKIFDVPT